MPLQNRVDPFGQIHAHPARGAFMGNRGIIHDAPTRTLTRRRWTTKAWIICVCTFPGRKRTVMGPRRYTELFFLDEPTALAAGHRPCFECRNADARAFAAAFARGAGVEAMRAGEIDAALHGQRAAAGRPLTPLAGGAIQALPAGAMVAEGRTAYLLTETGARPWDFSGYGEPVSRNALAERPLALITPPATVAALRAGYRARLPA